MTAKTFLGLRLILKGYYNLYHKAEKELDKKKMMRINKHIMRMDRMYPDALFCSNHGE